MEQTASSPSSLFNMCEFAGESPVVFTRVQHGWRSIVSHSPSTNTVPSLRILSSTGEHDGRRWTSSGSDSAADVSDFYDVSPSQSSLRIGRLMVKTPLRRNAPRRHLWRVALVLRQVHSERLLIRGLRLLWLWQLSEPPHQQQRQQPRVEFQCYRAKTRIT